LIFARKNKGTRYEFCAEKEIMCLWKNMSPHFCLELMCIGVIFFINPILDQIDKVGL